MKLIKRLAAIAIAAPLGPLAFFCTPASAGTCGNTGTAMTTGCIRPVDIAYRTLAVQRASLVAAPPGAPPSVTATVEDGFQPASVVAILGIGFYPDDLVTFAPLDGGPTSTTLPITDDVDFTGQIIVEVPADLPAGPANLYVTNGGGNVSAPYRVDIT